MKTLFLRQSQQDLGSIWLQGCEEGKLALMFLFFLRTHEGQFSGMVSEIKYITRTSLVAQWLRIRLPVQGTWVRALVREDPTRHGTTKPMHHNY